jgi:hypothetical protein
MFNVTIICYVIKIVSKNIFTHQHRDAFGVRYYYNVARGGVSNSVRLACKAVLVLVGA